ncbi:MAG TPA: hypothetical protein VHZ78_16305 [Rhizomicrobium sp.]|jgi:2-polyprenyl-3-methyl-5-hydroxy-6-metoxy-1,4-benzoquinol methylase|nr:hypothetical protein [Rhizomicrobium sp.]
MSAKPRTSDVNSRLWGARARDWASFQEVQSLPVYEAIVSRFVTPGTRCLDVGCGAGVAAWRGAKVTGIDAAEAMIAITRNTVIARTI